MNTVWIFDIVHSLAIVIVQLEVETREQFEMVKDHRGSYVVAVLTEQIICYCLLWMTWTNLVLYFHLLTRHSHYFSDLSWRKLGMSSIFLGARLYWTLLTNVFEQT